MSLSKNKQSLFGKEKQSETSTNSAFPTKTPGSTTSGTSVKFTGASGAKSGLTIADRQKKIDDARKESEKGMEQLKTSVFKWSADHLAAAPHFEKSAEHYRNAEEFRLSTEMMIKAAESHELYGSFAAAALALKKASETAKLDKDLKKTVALLKRAAEKWGMHGDIQRYGETLHAAAKELEESNPKEAKELHLKAIEVICPASTPQSQLNAIHPASLDIFRSVFTFLIATNDLKEAMKLAERMVDVFQAYENESSMCKFMLCITILQLTLGDAVAAQQTFLQKHLSNSHYMASKESEVADLFVLAFNNRDLDMLDQAKGHVQINYLEKGMQTLARKLSIFSVDDEFSEPIVEKKEKKSDLFSAPKAKAAAAAVPVETSKPSANKPDSTDNLQDLGADLDALDIDEDDTVTFANMNGENELVGDRGHHIQQDSDAEEAGGHEHAAAEEEQDEDEVDLS